MGWGRKLGRYKEFEIKADELLTIYQHVIARSVIEYAYRDGNVLAVTVRCYDNTDRTIVGAGAGGSAGTTALGSPSTEVRWPSAPRTSQ